MFKLSKERKEELLVYVQGLIFTPIVFGVIVLGLNVDALASTGESDFEIVNSKKISSDDFEKLSKSNIRGILTQLADRDDISNIAQMALSKKMDLDVITTLSRNHNIHDKTISSILSNSAVNNFNKGVRNSIYSFLLSNPNISLKNIHTIIEKSKGLEDVQLQVLNDNSDSSNIIKKVFEKTNFHQVQFQIAKNQNSPSVVLEKLSKHNDVSIRIEVIKNPSLSLSIISTMMNDSDVRISQIAKMRYRLINKMIAEIKSLKQ